MAFEYERQLTKLLHMNLRTEKHGDVDVTTVDMRFRYTSTNQTLAMFSPTLKSSLYMKEDSPQEEVNPDADHMTVIKNPKMGPIKWDEQYEHARFVIHQGASGKSDIVLGDAKVSKWLIDPKQGGTVVYDYLVQAHPTPKDIATLSGLLNQEVFVTLDPEGGDVDEEADTGRGANEIRDQLETEGARGGRARGSRKQTALIE